MHPLLLLCLLGAGPLAGIAVIALIRRGAAATPRPKILARIAVTPINELADGVVRRVLGEAVVAEERTVISPLTGTRCVLYRTVVKEWVSNAGSENILKTLATVNDGVDFLISDETGSIRVEGRDADFFSEPLTGRTGFGKPASEALTEVLAQVGEGTETMLGLNRVFEWEEMVLEPGDAVTAFGGIRRGTHSAGAEASGYRDARGLLMGRLRRGPVIVSNDPRAVERPFRA